jgi:hypothetical protein
MKADGSPWGAMTIERHWKLREEGVDLRVFVGGEDVTDRCRYANDAPGEMVAVCMVRGDGGLLVDPNTHGPSFQVFDSGIEIRCAS